MNYDNPDSNIPKSIDQYEGNTDSSSPFSALSNVINQSNHVEDSIDSKKLLITNNKILNVISKIQQDMYDEQDTSIKKIDSEEGKEEVKSVQNIITNMFIENGDTDFNFIGRRRYIPSVDTEEKKKKKEEEKKKEEAQKKRNKTQDKLNTQNEKRHKENIKRHKRSSRGLGALFALDGALAIGEAIIGTTGPIGVAAAMAGVIAAAAAAYVYVGDAEIDEAGGDSVNMSWLSKLSFSVSDDIEKKDKIDFENLKNLKVIEDPFFGENTVLDWRKIGDLDDKKLKGLSRNKDFSIKDREKFAYLSDLYSNDDMKSFNQFITNNYYKTGKGTLAPTKYKNIVLQDENIETRDSLHENAKKAFRFFVKKGYTESGAAGIVSNLMAESGPNIDPRRVNMSPEEDHEENKGSHGIAQWNKSRRKELFKFANVEYENYHSIKKISFTKQLEFLDYELNHSYKNVRDKLKNPDTTPEEASQYFMENFEKPKNNYQPQRLSDANFIKMSLEGSSEEYSTEKNSEGQTKNTGKDSKKTDTQNQKNVKNGSDAKMVSVLTKKHIEVENKIVSDNKKDEKIQTESQIDNVNKDKDPFVGDSGEGLWVLEKTNNKNLEITCQNDDMDSKLRNMITEFMSTSNSQQNTTTAISISEQSGQSISPFGLFQV
jgi:hypothetical protein